MHGYISRFSENQLAQSLARSPAVAILGPRQCGKSTLAKTFLASVPSVYLDLQDRVARNKLAEPELFFEQHRSELICLDEIQQMPEFFATLRSEIDARFYSHIHGARNSCFRIQYPGSCD